MSPSKSKITTGLQQALAAERRQRHQWAELNIGYDGNYIPNPYGYPRMLISWLQDTEHTKIIKSPSGTRISVAAPRAVWEESWIELAAKIGKKLLPILHIEDDIAYLRDSIWQEKSEWEDLFTVAYRPSKLTVLGMVKKGYVPLLDPTQDDCPWIEYPEIGAE